MKIIDKSVRDLKPYPQNAKKHDQRQIDNVANSIKRFGWQQPIVIDENDEVIIGHCRLLAAKQLGLESVPVTVASDLTQDETRELRIADNKTNESPWDFDVLDMELADLKFEGFDFEGMTGPVEIPDDLFAPAPDKEPDEPKQIQCPHCKMWFTP